MSFRFPLAALAAGSRPLTPSASTTCRFCVLIQRRALSQTSKARTKVEVENEKTRSEGSAASPSNAASSSIPPFDVANVRETDAPEGTSASALKRQHKLETKRLRPLFRAEKKKQRASSSKWAESIKKQAHKRGPSADEVRSWEDSMRAELERQVDFGRDSAEAEGTKRSGVVSGSDDSEMGARLIKDEESRQAKAYTLAQSMEAARLKQPKSYGEGSNRQRSGPTLLVPGMGTGAYPPKITFEATELVYPPSDRYPPLLPLVREVDLLVAARAFGVVRSCEIEWDSKSERGGRWRKTVRPNAYYEERGMIEHLETEQGLEYLGDAVLHLLSRTLIMAQHPGKTVAAYNYASSWLVSNECFAFMFEDAGLEDERDHVARRMTEESKQRELQETAATLTEEERKYREEMAWPTPIVGPLRHLRKADYLEAYVGAVYLLYGFPTASKWCTALLAPWVDRIGRTPEFQQRRLLSPAGEAQRQADERAEKQRQAEQAAREQPKSWWQRLISPLLASEGK